MYGIGVVADGVAARHWLEVASEDEVERDGALRLLAELPGGNSERARADRGGNHEGSGGGRSSAEAAEPSEARPAEPREATVSERRRRRRIEQRGVARAVLARQEADDQRAREEMTSLVERLRAERLQGERAAVSVGPTERAAADREHNCRQEARVAALLGNGGSRTCRWVALFNGDGNGGAHAASDLL